MDPSAAGRLRGFRAPSADPVVPPTPPEAAEPVESAGPMESDGAVQSADSSGPAEPAELLVAGPPPRRPRRPGTTRPRSGPRTPGNDRRWALAASGVLVVAMVVIAVLAFELGSGSGAEDADAPPTPTPTPAVTASPLPVTELFQQVAPSVVLITTSKGSLGSGVIVTDTGTILTANHVISDGGAVSVAFADGTKTTATIDSANPKTDIATLTPKKLPEVVVPATLGGAVAVGADVVAIGNPLGLRYSTTTGVVSGLGRETKTKSGALSNLIQFDAAVNPGSSGGPLLNAQGLVVGVVVSIADPGKDDAFAGIAFAVPIGTALGGGSGDGPGGGGPQL